MLNKSVWFIRIIINVSCLTFRANTESEAKRGNEYVRECHREDVPVNLIHNIILCLRQSTHPDDSTESKTRMKNKKCFKQKTFMTIVKELNLIQISEIIILFLLIINYINY